MALGLYMDVHVPRAIAAGLKLRGVDVITAQEDESATLPDAELLDRVTQLDRVLFTFDEDFLIEADARQAKSIEFSGIVYARPLRISVSECISDLELIAKAATISDLVNRVLFLPF